METIDWSLSLKLAGNQPSTAEELLMMFMAQLPAARKSIVDAWEKNNFRAFSNAVHRLHGSTCYCGVPRLKKIAFDIETHLKNKRMAELASLVEHLVGEIEKVETTYRSMKESGFSFHRTPLAE